MQSRVTVTLSFPSDHVLDHPQAGLWCRESLSFHRCLIQRIITVLFHVKSAPRSFAFVRILHLCGGTQGCVTTLSYPIENPVLTIIKRVHADFVQDLYIRELKAYKPAPAVRNVGFGRGLLSLNNLQAKDAHVGAVKAYSLPPKPQAPAVPADLASELAAYDATEPTKAEVKAETTSVQDSSQGPEAFLDMLEADVPEDNHHH
jgi:F-type H+-transporting ATPase subunit h